MRELIIGGARSGKSSLALKRADANAKASGCDVVYVATATPSDSEMQARIATHRLQRPAAWRTVEASSQLAKCLRSLDAPTVFIVVDCLTLWMANILCPSHASEPEFDEVSWLRERAEFLSCLTDLKNDIVLVSNELGLGVVPDNAVARRFRDEHGWLNQAVAEVCDRVTWVTAGLPLILKAPS